MSDVNYKKISTDGLWNNNPATVILDSALLAVTDPWLTHRGLALPPWWSVGRTCVSLIRHYVTDAVRLRFWMIIAAMTTVIEMLMQAYTFELLKSSVSSFH